MAITELKETIADFTLLVIHGASEGALEVIKLVISYYDVMRFFP